MTPNKTTYNKIKANISNWPEWKKKICNEELLTSKNAKKI